ncbi:MAG: hypothetical protein JSR82_12405 [Verrucomicrobia bacterium]|nr:hypothetical protein [Verrucomicrobiota bacterium]
MVHLLGIRHHGPGSARSVLAALAEIGPDLVLLEGPPEADELLPLAALPGMEPPVALLLYRPDVPQRGVFYPFAEFSPEWQALRWALAADVPVRFMDLPQRHQLVDAPAQAEENGEAPSADEDDVLERGEDPLDLVARAAGASDGEAWWEQTFERRHAGLEVFAAVQELMTAVRLELARPLSRREARREAWMRQTIREAQRGGAQRIAVVCGAWHVPALAQMPTAKSDAETLKGLPKAAVTAAWIPWTYDRLTAASGYGAGVHSPGYYGHLWDPAARGEVALRWMARIAQLLRAEDLESSTASVVEAVRLAEATSALRGQPVPGLAEFREAARAIFCFGGDAPMQLIRERLEVGAVLGRIPDEAPQVPLQRDLQREQKRLRLPPEALERTLELDLRKPNDLERSQLLHRLGLLGIGWGKVLHSRGKGTFRETWRLRWQPEFEIQLVEAAPLGHTVAEASAGAVLRAATEASALADLTGLVERVLLAELPAAVEPLLQRLASLAALTGEVTHLLAALPPLVQVLRYGNVRQTDSELLGPVVTGLVARSCVGLVPACAQLNDESAAEMRGHLDAAHAALVTLADDALLADWRAALQRLGDSAGLHGLLAGRCARLLLDDGTRSVEETSLRLSRELSRAAAPAQAAAWIEGFVSGGVLLLIHRDELWGMLDVWLSGLSAEHFTEILPLLRRTFGAFSAAERRQLGDRARRGSTSPAAALSASVENDVDLERARLVLPLLRTLLGPPVAADSP